MERLKSIKSTLVSLVETQLGDVEHTDAKELGEVVDMIKDLEEAMYYCAIVEAMEKSKEEGQEDISVRSRMGYTEHFPHGEYNWDTMDWRPYYYYTQSGRGSANQYGGSGSRSTSSRMGYNENEMMGYSDSGNSGNGGSQSGSNSSGQTAYYGGPTYYYTENKPTDVNEVSKYLSELSDSLPHMMEKASPEDKKMISEKLQQINTKVNSNQ